MTGLIWKDFLVLRKTLRAYVLVFFFYAVLSLMGIFPVTGVCGCMMGMMMLLPLSTFTYDEQSKWDRCAMSLPFSRRTVVAARYLLILVIVLISAGFGFLICLLLSIQEPAAFVENLCAMMTALGAGLVLADVLFPLSYRLGPERARPYTIVIVLLIFFLIFGAYRLGFLNAFSMSWAEQLSPPRVVGLFSLIPLTALVGLGVSYLVSCKIVEKKEF